MNIDTCDATDGNVNASFLITGKPPFEVTIKEAKNTNGIDNIVEIIDDRPDCSRKETLFK